MKINLAIADDHPLVIDGLHHILTGCSDIGITGSYMDGKELLAGLVQQQPDVLLLDIHMPGKTGEELMDIINLKYPSIRVLALTNLDNVHYIKSMLRKGALGYVLKTIMKDVLLEAIRTVYHGKKYIQQSLMDKIVQDTLQSKKEISANPSFSKREREILNYIAQDMTSQQIAEKLFVSKRTVDFHRLNLTMKFGVKSVGAMIKKGIQLGLIE